MCSDLGRFAVSQKGKIRLKPSHSYLSHSLTQKNWDSENTENIKQEGHKFPCLPYIGNQ